MKYQLSITFLLISYKLFISATQEDFPLSHVTHSVILNAKPN